MFIHKLQKLALATVAIGTVAVPSVLAQATSTIFDPYVPGVQLTPPLVPPAQGPAETPGSGPTPPPEITGQQGPAPLMPWVPAIPVAPTDPGLTGLSLPLGSAALTPPGVLGPALSGFIPPPNSAPGPMPPFLNPQGGINPAQQVTVEANAPLPGTGGYYTSIPKIRKGGQKTDDFGYQGEPSILGGGGPAQDSVTLLGPLAGWGVPFGIPTGVGYNNGPAGSNNDLYQSSVDLGGGMRMGVGGGTVISTGQTIQDYGYNLFTQNQGPLMANQSTEFGQGLHGSGLNVSKTTDFGNLFGPYNPANMNIGTPNPNYNWNPNPPNAIETNF
jgi:hypothetical protein